MTENSKLLSASQFVDFADVAHQTLSFDATQENDRLVLQLIDTPWVQRLRRISQTGNTRLVYMFAEHSRFGHCLGAAYLASSLLKLLAHHHPQEVSEHGAAVVAAALLHDIGHVAPGSHLGEKIWSPGGEHVHESITQRIIAEDPAINGLLSQVSPELPQKVIAILGESSAVPKWCRAVISGGGWNADRGNWAIVDSAMCAVSYGRYNVKALLEAFRLAHDGRLVLQESRLDALTHFFVARDSMYRQVYQHRVLQAADILTFNIIKRLRDLFASGADFHQTSERLGLFCDPVMRHLLRTCPGEKSFSLEDVFQMTESWWSYHLERWGTCRDQILSDLAQRLVNRRLFKTIRLVSSAEDEENLVERAKSLAQGLNLDPDYYVGVVNEADKHRRASEEISPILLDDGRIVPVESVEPMIAQLVNRSYYHRRWLVVPPEIKAALGRVR